MHALPPQHSPLAALPPQPSPLAALTPGVFLHDQQSVFAQQSDGPCYGEQGAYRTLCGRL